MTEPITLGRFLPGREEGALQVLCDAPELEGHVRRPWFAAYAAQRLDLPRTNEKEAAPRRAEAGEDLLARHALVCGSTGSGKTRLALHLLAEQIKAGASVVMLDPKAETLRHLLHLAYGAGVSPEEVTLLSPAQAGAGAPGWNPLDGRASGLSPSQAAADFVSVLAKSSGSWGPRLQDVLTNALLVISAHGLSLFELARFLQREDYREGLLRKRPDASVMGDPVVYEEARDFFRQEFGAWGKSERATAVAPVLNKFRELLRSPFLRALLCARRSTLDVSSLWQKRGLVLVHLDGTGLGDEGARLLGGLLAHQLLRTAMRASGPVPVVLALDEMGVSEGFLGSALCQILAIARSRHLRLLVACQHLAQLSDELRAALLANTAVQAFFRLGHADARLVASALSAGTGERVSRIAADVAKRNSEGQPEAWAEVVHTVRDGYGDALKLSAPAWTAFREVAKAGDGKAQVSALKRLACVSGVARLYVHAPDTRQPQELGKYVLGLAREEYRLCGPAPIRLIVSFPRPRLSLVSRQSESERQQGWTRTLMELPTRQAVLRLSGGGPGQMTEPGVIRVVEVPDAGAQGGFEKFISAAIAGSGQSAKEIEETQGWRRDQVERVAGGKVERTETVEKQKAIMEPASSGRRAATAKANHAKRPAGATASTPARASVPAKTVPVGTVGEDGSLA